MHPCGPARFQKPASLGNSSSAKAASLNLRPAETPNPGHIPPVAFSKGKVTLRRPGQPRTPLINPRASCRVTRRTKRNSARSTTKPAIPIPNALTPSFFVILCHHHPYSIALRLIWRCAHGPTHREPPFIPPTEPGNAALVRAPSTRGCVSAGR